MHITNLSALNANDFEHATKKSGAFFPLFALNWLAMCDSRYRAARVLRRIPDALSRDMGMSRKDVNTAFYQKYGNHIETRNRP